MPGTIYVIKNKAHQREQGKKKWGMFYFRRADQRGGIKQGGEGSRERGSHGST